MFLPVHTYYQARGYKITPQIDGQPMILDGDYWKFITDIVLTPQLIENRYYDWSVYVGDFIGNGFSYDMWLPHEAVKAYIKAVRGREDGAITQADLTAMGKYDAGIARGYIRPNNKYVTGSDGKIYGGWGFHTKPSFNYNLVK